VIVQLKEVGFEGFLIGEYFMKADEPHKECADFIERINQMEATLKHGIA
jgi:indole-3-glycerol phosphate synthase